MISDEKYQKLKYRMARIEAENFFIKARFDSLFMSMDHSRESTMGMSFICPQCSCVPDDNFQCSQEDCYCGLNSKERGDTNDENENLGG